MLVSHRGQQLPQTKEEQEYDDDNEGTITTTSCRGGQEVSYRRRHGHDDRWFCDEHDEQDQDHESEREVAFADELPRRARGDLHRATGGSGLDSKIGDLDRRMSRLAAPPSPTTGSAKPPTQPQPPQLCSTGEGDESGEERRRSPVSSFTAVVDITTSTSSSSSSAARLPLVAEKEEDDDDEQVHAAAQEQDQSEQDVDEDEEEEEEENEEDDEEAELVEVDEDEAERAEEVAEELAPFDAATEHLLHLLDELRDDNGQYRYRRGQVVAVAGGVRTLKQRVEDFAEPLAGFCPAQASQLRLAVRSLSNAVVQLLNGLQVPPPNIKSWVGCSLELLISRMRNELAISCRRARKHTLKARWRKSAVLWSPCDRSSSSSCSKHAPRPKPTRYLLACELSCPAIGV
jgi:hypothetical protein